jgi:hypothetical protein
MDRRNYMENLEKYRKMKEIYDNNYIYNTSQIEVE